MRFADVERYLRLHVAYNGEYQEGYQGYVDGEKKNFLWMDSGAAILINTRYDRAENAESRMNEVRLLHPSRPEGVLIYSEQVETDGRYAGSAVYTLEPGGRTELRELISTIQETAVDKELALKYLTHPESSPSVYIGLREELKQDPDILQGVMNRMCRECTKLYDDIIRDSKLRPDGGAYLGDSFPRSAADCFLDRIAGKTTILGITNEEGHRYEDMLKMAHTALKYNGHTDALEATLRSYDHAALTIQNAGRIRGEVAMREELERLARQEEELSGRIAELEDSREKMHEEYEKLQAVRYPVTMRLFQNRDYWDRRLLDARRRDELAEALDESKSALQEQKTDLAEIRGRRGALSGRVTPVSQRYQNVAAFDEHIGRLEYGVQSQKYLYQHIKELLMPEQAEQVFRQDMEPEREAQWPFTQDRGAAVDVMSAPAM